MITYHSSKSLRHHLSENKACKNKINVMKNRRIVMYRLNWLDDENNSYLNNDDDTDSTFENNGEILCKNHDSLVLSELNEKYTSSLSTKNKFRSMNSIYCARNPLKMIMTKSNKMYMNYRHVANSKLPLIFELSYFSYKYLYTETDTHMFVNFSQIIPANLNVSKLVDTLEFIIQIPDDLYLIPVISECNTHLLGSNKVFIRTGDHVTPFNLNCLNTSFTFMNAMENQLKVEFNNIKLKELRDKSISFRIDFKTLPRTLRDLTGSFESTRTSDLISSNEMVKFEWKIDLEPNYFIKLNVLNLTNWDTVVDLSFIDDSTNMTLFDQISIIENFKNSKHIPYIFATNRLRVLFKYKKSNELPYINCEYTSESKIINADKYLSEGVITFNNSFTKNKLEWLIIAPNDYLVISKIQSYSSKQNESRKGQLIFSLLNNGYPDNGVYHFDFKTKKDSHNVYDKETDFVVSKENMMKIEYLSAGEQDNFKLVYSFSPRILHEPAGFITPFINDLADTKIFVSKMTDQNWMIRAPYGKKIQIFTRFIDLLEEKPCSKSSVKFLNPNGTEIVSKCGHEDLSPGRFSNFNSTLLLVSPTNEIKIRFRTLDTKEVVYKFDPENGYKPYDGFKFYYSFQETPGDCYFHLMSNIECGYESLNELAWNINKENLFTHMAPNKENEFNSLFCPSCYLTATIPVQSNKKAILMSPVIDRSKKYLKFTYKLIDGGMFTVRVVDKNAPRQEDNLNDTLLVKSIKESTKTWKTARAKLGNNLINDFRLLFILESTPGSSMSPSILLNSIELFEQDLEYDEDNYDKNDDYEQLGLNDKSKSTCQKYMTPCDNNKCANGATCLNYPDIVDEDEQHDDLNDKDYSCLCGFGYTGKFCEIKLNPCDLPDYNKCSPNSKCINTETDEVDNSDSSHMSYKCKCDSHYFGKYCEQKYSPCKLKKNRCNQLSGQGTCIDLGTEKSPDSYTCQCSPMYTGNECEIKIKATCLTTDCNKQDKDAVCLQHEDRIYCKCSPGFEGYNCTNIDDCASSPCLNGATCIDEVNAFKCKCDKRYEGKFCEQAKICSKCDKIGTLHCNSTIEPKCVCQPTHTGIHCETPKDLCARPDQCVKGKCVSNKIDTFKCVCDPGYKGAKCDIKETACDKGLCKNGAICRLNPDFGVEGKPNNQREVTCDCAEGYFGNFCEKEINHCESDPCKNGGTCFNKLSTGSHYCFCLNGFTGSNCERKSDNCLNNKCSHGSTCISSTSGSYRCECPVNKFGRYCNETQDVCLNNRCVNGICVPKELNPNEYDCSCRPGFTGDNCETEISRCESGTCNGKGTCLSFIGGHKCKCLPGYEGTNCERQVSYCSLETTFCNHTNMERCTGYLGGRKCHCLPNYTGVQCEIPLDYCSSRKPCFSGTCIPIDLNDYKCINCAPGFTGKNCSELIDYCSPKSPCENGGRCYSKLGGFYCQCKDDFMGERCEEKIELVCLHNKCQHGSKCIPTDSGYKCECSNLYEGQYCEKKIDLCKDKVCTYGYCENGECTCDSKILFCKKYSKCNSMVCENGGTCVDVIVGNLTEAMCLCPPGLQGVRCENSVFCDSSFRVCGSSDQCKTVNGTYQCDCDKPFIGHKCNSVLEDLMPVYSGQLKEDKNTMIRNSCKFGVSKESKIFMGIVGIGLVIFALAGLFIGHRSIVAMRKRLRKNTAPVVNTRYNLMQSSASTVSNPNLNSIETGMSKSALDLNKSSFSIPRPAIRL